MPDDVFATDDVIGRKGRANYGKLGPDGIDGWCAANRRAHEATRRGAVAS